MDKTIFEQMGGTIIRKEITFCPTCPHLKAFLLGYGDS